MPALPKNENITAPNASDLRQTEIQHNAVVNDLATYASAGANDVVIAWSTPTAVSLQALGRGSTDTLVCSGAFNFSTAGLVTAKAAVTTGLAPTAQTVPADTWAVYAYDIASGGTTSVLPGALNATTGYATEALAIAGCPARVTAKARMGYVTVKTKAATAWIGATDALAGGATGNPASVTNYYPADGVMAATGVPTNCAHSGVPIYSTNTQWNGTRNGVVIPTVLAIGSTDVRVSTTAFTFNANGINNIAKAAVAAGTAFGALGTISADTWGVIAFIIDAAGTITYLSGAGNYSGDYKTEAQALGALTSLAPTAGKCLFGVCTIKTKAATAFVVGTDSPAGGATGNVASATNYYPVTGVALPASGIGFTGQSSAQIANRQGQPLTSVNY